MLEKIGAFSLSAPIRTGPRSDALCDARICYNHLAGRRGVALFEALLKIGAIAWRDGQLELGDNHQVFARFGIDNPASSCRECLDWSERRSHLGGALGRQIMDAMLAQNWAIRSEGRVIRLTPKGKAQMREMGLQI